MVYIIVPVYNRIESTKKFIDSVLSQNCLDVLILVVDDCSTDKYYDFINSFESNLVIYSRTPKELFWGGAINFGLNVLQKKVNLKENDIIIFANNDVILPNNFLSSFLKKISSNSIIHPQVIDADTKLYISAGAKIVLWFPYITKHPKNIKQERYEINLGTARFIAFNYSIFKKINGIEPHLPHYLGDNNFTLRAWKLGYKIFIMRDYVVQLDNKDTGMKAHNIKTFKILVESFTNIRSPNCIKYRFIYLRKHFNFVLSLFIHFSIILNIIIKFFVGKIKKV